ncbi:MAG: hypothetical protein ACPLW7_05575 [Minisyncoccia bacterium]
MIFRLGAILVTIKTIINIFIIILLLIFQLSWQKIFKIRLFKLFNKENQIKILKSIFIFLIIFNFFLSFSFSVMNFIVWENDPISKHLLPPFTPILYILSYSWFHYFFAPVVTIVFALIIFYSIQKLNQKFNNIFFYEEESYLAALGILITSWPNCLIYLSLVLFLGVVSHFIILFFHQIITWRAKRGRLRNTQTAERAGFESSQMVGRESGEVCASSKIHAGDFGTFSKASPFRLSLLFFWLPCALLILLLGGIISKYIGTTQLII